MRFIHNLQTKVLVVSFLITIGLGNLALVPVAVAAPAAPNNVASLLKSDACAGLNQLDSSQSCGANSGKPINDLIKTIVTLLSWIVGIASVIVIIIAGLRYVTSGGDSNGISSAKNTLMYALIGLVVAALAQFLVHFAFQEATGAQCKSNPDIAATSKNCK